MSGNIGNGEPGEDMSTARVQFAKILQRQRPPVVDSSPLESESGQHPLSSSFDTPSANTTPLPLKKPMEATVEEVPDEEALPQDMATVSSSSATHILETHSVSGLQSPALDTPPSLPETAGDRESMLDATLVLPSEQNQQENRATQENGSHAVRPVSHPLPAGVPSALPYVATASSASVHGSIGRPSTAASAHPLSLTDFNAISTNNPRFAWSPTPDKRGSAPPNRPFFHQADGIPPTDAHGWQSKAWRSPVIPNGTPASGVPDQSPLPPRQRDQLPREPQLPPHQHGVPPFQGAWPLPAEHAPNPPGFDPRSPPMPYFQPMSMPAPPPFTPIEQVPLSGYQILSAKLAGHLGGVPVKPMYRRFAALNHRLLLHYQDEIAELEDELHELDAKGTRERITPAGGIYPASRRYEAQQGSQLYWRREELLKNIGYKLWLYNKTLASFGGAANLPFPGDRDLQDYRAWLINGNHIVEDEVRFLDHRDDLVTMNEAAERGYERYSDGNRTPMPRPATASEPFIKLPPRQEAGEIPSAAAGNGSDAHAFGAPQPLLPPEAIARLAGGLFVATLVPIFTFSIIAEVAGRMTVIVLTASSVMTMLVQTGIVHLLREQRGLLPLILCTAAYAVVMATAAVVFH